MRPGVRTLVVSALACAAFAAAPTALANDFQQVYDYYKHHGSIRACQFSETQLKNAERQTPPDVEQYAPSFLDAVATAREQSGSCNKAKTTAPAAAPAPAPPTTSTPAAAPTPSVPTATPPATTQPVATATTPAPTPPAAAGAPALDTERTAHHSSAPAAVWTLAGLAALAVLAAIAAAVAWFFGWYPDRWLGARPDGIGREFADWLRLGL